MTWKLTLFGESPIPCNFQKYINLRRRKIFINLFSKILVLNVIIYLCSSPGLIRRGQWNSMMINFANTRHGIPSIGSLKIQSVMQPSPLSMNWAELHFWPLGHLSNWISWEKPKKWHTKNCFSPLENWHFSENHPHITSISYIVLLRRVLSSVVTMSNFHYS